jgi:hypothetical protein
MLEPLHIIIDSREQSPWSWSPADAITEVAGLAVGDYALAEDTEEPRVRGQLRPVRFSIERKSLEDFLGSVANIETGSLAKLAAQTSFPARVVIVEGNFADMCFSERGGEVIPPPHNHPDMRPAFVARRIAEMTMMGVGVLMCGNAELAAGMAFRLFRRRWETSCQL